MTRFLLSLRGANPQSNLYWAGDGRGSPYGCPGGVNQMAIDYREILASVKKEPSLKTVADIVAYKLLQGTGRDEDHVLAEAAVAEYITEHFDSLADLRQKTSGDLSSLQSLAEGVYGDYQRKRRLTFQTVKEKISKGEDIALKTITDIVAYKLYQSPENKGPEINFITAETFVVQYIADHFVSMRDFQRRLEELGQGIYALRSFAEEVYHYYCDHKPGARG